MVVIIQDDGGLYSDSGNGDIKVDGSKMECHNKGVGKGD